MGRSRSRSPARRERRRSRSASRDRERKRRERERSRSRDRDRRRSRSRSTHRRRSRSPPRRARSESDSPSRLKEAKEKEVKPIEISAEDMKDKTEEEIEMMKTMGFGSFDTTKGKKTKGSVNAHATNVSQKRKYRLRSGSTSRIKFVMDSIRRLGELIRPPPSAVYEQERWLQQTAGLHRLRAVCEDARISTLVFSF
ncbi:U4/U6.U5 small nuclear ribonucleoprotein 27 kDa protein isoform X1 [Gadus macrocephalus]|uniref:U4/U6.U5 small nuclear ribonucleoprotein 27 kDa protein isoform X1 n=1 Tax=Gadus macrocephalus TaxID=80720 RepID=UPI0028CB6D94|nr:U4/U6.U5 small nuclear ribonucleoprotein 27 kDa protein isoform X1 [Gadus macrocephalus]